MIFIPKPRIALSALKTQELERQEFEDLAKAAVRDLVVIAAAVIVIDVAIGMLTSLVRPSSSDDSK